MTPPDRHYGPIPRRPGSPRPPRPPGRQQTPPTGFHPPPTPPRTNYYEQPLNYGSYTPGAPYSPPTTCGYGYGSSRRGSLSSGVATASGSSGGYFNARPSVGGSSLYDNQYFSTPPPPLSTSSNVFNYSVDHDEDLQVDHVQEPIDNRKKPKTPPDMCAVCASTVTPEWRKGPAGIRSLCNGCGLLGAKRSKDRSAKGVPEPSSIDEMKDELVGIGAERFRSVDGNWALPPNTLGRIHETIARTERAAESLATRPTRRVRAADRQAAGVLLGMAGVGGGGMARRGSFDQLNASAMAPVSVTGTRSRRAGSTSIGSRPSGLPSPSGYAGPSYSGASLFDTLLYSSSTYGGPPVYSSHLRSTGTPIVTPRSYSPVRSFSPVPSQGSTKMSLDSILHHPARPPVPGPSWGYRQDPSRGRASPVPSFSFRSSSRTSTPVDGRPGSQSYGSSSRSSTPVGGRSGSCPPPPPPPSSYRSNSQTRR